MKKFGVVLRRRFTLKAPSTIELPNTINTLKRLERVSKLMSMSVRAGGLQGGLVRVTFVEF